LLLRRRRLIADGNPVKLGTRSLDLLLVLLEADGSLVTKEELLSRVWPGIHVSEENVKVQIFALRKALGEERDFIRTETGRGYRFTAAVKSTVSRNASLHAAPRRQRQRQRTMSRSVTMLALPRCSVQTTYLPTVRRSRLRRPTS
jgi:DNA-binding winged helix-turn-helix (wHTH) protein